LRRLAELIPEELRDHVYCMHLDEGFKRGEAWYLGFNIAEIE